MLADENRDVGRRRSPLYRCFTIIVIDANASDNARRSIWRRAKKKTVRKRVCARPRPRARAKLQLRQFATRFRLIC